MKKEDDDDDDDDNDDDEDDDEKPDETFFAIPALVHTVEQLSYTVSCLGSLL